METGNLDGPSDGCRMQRIDVALKVHFAILAAMGGMILGFGESSGALPLIAFFSAAFSLVFIDLLGLFALPPLAAYIGMGLVAAYCISDFVPLDPSNNRQLTAVAQLLVLVQAVLMLQKKTRRVFEQIGVFCLLELVVAAVFNNALIYAALLVPVSLLGLSALVLLQVAAAAEPAMGERSEDHAIWPAAPFGRRRPDDDNIRTTAASSVASFAAAGRRLPRATLLVSSLPILLVASVFFYALPRIAESDSSTMGATPVVGFSESIELDQIGHLQKSNTPVMRLQLTDQKTSRPYLVVGPLYLRGTVLENYDFSYGSGRWSAALVGPGRIEEQLPQEFQPSRLTDRLFYDDVAVDITIQPQSTGALFATAPYHRLGISTKVHHLRGSWTVQRREAGTDIMYPRMSYRFGTHAFFNGSQTPLIRNYAVGESSRGEYPPLPGKGAETSRLNRSPLIRFEPARLPTVKSIADALVAEMPPEMQTPEQIATRFNSYLRFEADLKYTLDLTMGRDESLDPIEQFIRTDRRGHCQYFASTLAMMLRSQGIPSRLVVGYKSDEFSPFGQHYTIRQLHAHAWVEALFSDDQLSDEQLLYGQSEDGPVWMRLDPTPGAEASSTDASVPIAHRFDYLQALWEQYVLDMDASQQDDSVLDSAAIGGTHGTYTRFFTWLKKQWAQWQQGSWQNGGVGRRALTNRSLFSWPAALLGVLGMLAMVTLYRVGLPNSLTLWRRRSATERPRLVSRVPFYVRACEQLQRLGVTRGTAETASEFMQTAAARFAHPAPPEAAISPQRAGAPSQTERASLSTFETALSTITDAYHRTRFGGQTVEEVEDEPLRQAVRQLETAVDQRVASHRAGTRQV